MGAAGTLHLGYTYPQMWAALAPLSPPVLDRCRRHVGRLQPLPIKIATGDADKITKIEPVRELVATLKSLGIDVRCQELKGSGHAGPIMNSKLMSEVFDFFDEHRRESPAPTEVALTSLEEQEEHREEPQKQQGTDEKEDPVQQPSGSDSSTPEVTTAQAPPRRSQMARGFHVLGVITARTLPVELAAWSAFYSIKSTWWSLVASAPSSPSFA